MYGADTYTGGDNANNRETTFKISTKLNVPIVTLSTEHNVNLAKQLNEGFKRPVYWNEYKSKIETKEANDLTLTRFPLDASFQGVNRLFAVALITLLKMLLIIQLTIPLIKFKKRAIRNIFFQE